LAREARLSKNPKSADTRDDVRAMLLGFDTSYEGVKEHRQPSAGGFDFGEKGTLPSVGRT
jgi:hypothetical protein